MTAKKDDFLGYKFWYMYFPEKEVFFEVVTSLERGFFLCKPVKEVLKKYGQDKDGIHEIVLSSRELTSYQELDAMSD